MKLVSLFVLLGAAAFGDTYTGIITDSMCVNQHSMMKTNKPDDDCVRACVKANPAATKYVLFDGKNAYKLSDQQAPDAYAARRVVVKGKLNAKTKVIAVESISAAR